MFRFFITLPVLAFYVILAFLMFPIHLLTKRKLGGIVFRHCSAVMLKMAGVNCRAEGLENITPDETYLVVSNHQSIADIPIIGAILPINIRVLATLE